MKIFAISSLFVLTLSTTQAKAPCDDLTSDCWCCDDRRSLHRLFDHLHGAEEVRAKQHYDAQQRRRVAGTLKRCCRCDDQDLMISAENCCESIPPICKEPDAPDEDEDEPWWRAVWKEIWRNIENWIDFISSKVGLFFDTFHGRRRYRGVRELHEFKTQGIDAILADHREPLAKPYDQPNTADAVLLSSDPGIWTIRDLFSSSNITKLHKLINTIGHDYGKFQTTVACIDAPPLEEQTAKLVMQLEPNLAKRPEDAHFIRYIMDKIQNLWPGYVFGDVQVAQTMGGFGPVMPHFDTDGSHLTYTSAVLYLNDNPAGTLFPNLDPILAVPAQRGAITTWINKHEDGLINRRARTWCASGPQRLWRTHRLGV